MKQYIIYAGVNGAGKSTLYHSRLHDEMPRINTDEMVRQMGSWTDAALQMKAGAIAVKRIKEYFENDISFNQETTLCGHSIMNNIQKAKDLGYNVEMYYVGVSDSQLAKDRVAERVEQGGHGIPEDVIEKRYSTSLENLVKAIPLCDKIVVYDNSKYFTKIAEFEKGKLLWFNDVPNANWLKTHLMDNSIGLDETISLDDKQNVLTAPPKYIKNKIIRKKDRIKNRSQQRELQQKIENHNYDR